MTDLTGLTAVVTGGSQGIGLAMATGMARAGARVALWARNQERTEAAAEDLQDMGLRALAVKCDVADEAQVAAAMEQTVSELGPLGCLVANAGITDTIPFPETSLGRWHAVLKTNLDGAFLATREAARRFIDQESGGSIVVVSSMISRYGGTRQAAYTVSKTGLIGLGRTLAVELARYKVRCNILVPGWVSTPMSSGLESNDRFREATVARTPARRWAKPAELEEVAAFLADPRLTYHTGSEVVVDGGYTVY